MGALNLDVLNFAKNNIGKRVFAKNVFNVKGNKGSGQCWDLAYEALRKNSGKLPTRSAKYIWSDMESVGNPGDILQFSEGFIINVKSDNIRIPIDITVNGDEYKGAYYDFSYKRTLKFGLPQNDNVHTSIFNKKNPDGSISVYEQHVGGSSKVQLNAYFLLEGVYTISKNKFKTIFRMNTIKNILEKLPIKEYLPDNTLKKNSKISVTINSIPAVVSNRRMVITKKHLFACMTDTINITVKQIGSGVLKMYKPQVQKKEKASFFHTSSSMLAYDLPVKKEFNRPHNYLI